MNLKEDRKGIEKKFYDLCLQVVQEQGLELYDLDYLPGSGELRIFIYNPTTKTALIEDCVKVDHALTPHIDSLDWMPERLTLEVSSPGVYRNLRTRQQFEAATGEYLQLTLAKTFDQQEGAPELPKKIMTSKKIVGKLLECHDDDLVLEIDEKVLKVKLTNIKKANVEGDTSRLLSQ